MAEGVAYGAHESVLLKETIELLQVEPGKNYCDVTLGGGGHSNALLTHCAPNGQLFGIDQDPQALTHCRERFKAHAPRVHFAHGNFGDIEEICNVQSWPKFDGVIADLGVSSHQIDTAARGFSFSKDGPLDMRMDDTGAMTAKQLIDTMDVRELTHVIRTYGEEKRALSLARAIKDAANAGTLESTAALAELVRQTGGGGRLVRKGRHAATRVFQALRIAVNDELGVLKKFLGAVVNLVRPGGRVAIISFHSLEDALVKRAFRGRDLAETKKIPRQWPPMPEALPETTPARPKLKSCTSRPIEASPEELQLNPRARSAKLRVAMRVEPS